jgi:predicted anti-sigma-YlaC factor YlaD
MKKKRYWGLAVFAVIWVFAVIIMNAADGRHGVGFVTVLWSIVAYYAIKGNIKGILSTAKVAIAIQIVVGVGFTLWLANDRSAQNLLGDPIIFAISIGIPTLAWVILFFWAKPKFEQVEFEESVETAKPDAAKNLPEETERQTIDKAAALESTPLHTSHPTKSDTKTSTGAWILLGIAIAVVLFFALNSETGVRQITGDRSVAPSPVRPTPTAQQTRIETVYLDPIDSEWVRGIDGRNSTFRVLVRNNSRFSIDAPEISAKMEPCSSNSFLVRSAQQALNRLGFDAGPVDGRIGSRTRTAIADFQASRGLSVSRELDDATTSALSISQTEESFPSFGRGFIVGGYDIPPGEVAYVDFINFYGQTRGREFCYRVSRDVRVLQN